jgi:PAS domain S-box-containing protein
MMAEKSEEERINEMIEAVMKVARGDYSVQVELSNKNDGFDSLAIGINMMIDDIRAGVEELQREITEREQAEETMQRHAYELGERVKELNCLYGISNLVEKQGGSFEEMIQAIVAIIPSSWQYPEVTCARIILNGQEFVTDNFRETVWKQTSDITVHDNRVGIVEVYYLEERPECDGGPFLKEERKLIDAIAERVGRITEHMRAEEMLRASKEWLSITLRSIGDALIATDAKGHVTLMNPVAQTLTGWNEEDAIGEPLEDVFNIINEETGKQVENPATRVIREGVVIGLANHTVLIAKDGTKWPIDDSGAPIRDDKGSITGVVLVFRDITERKQAEEDLRESEEKWHSLTWNTDDTIQIVDKNSVIRYINRTIPPTTPEGVIGKTIYEYVSKEHHDVMRESLKKVYQTGEPDSYEVTLDMSRINPEIGTLWFYTKVVPITTSGEVTAVIMIATNVTERKQMEEQVKVSLAEKELLLKEVHHRVKNNMQIISSLLKLQARGIEGNETRELFNDSQNRIKSMALVYNKLYQSADLARIGLKDYVSELSNGLIQSYRGTSGKITTKVEGDNILLGVDLAIPCGLFINELISNSLKYAFPNGGNGEVRVSLRETDETNIEIIVSDNGVGIPDNIDLASTNTLGLSLVTTLVENQLGGKLELDRSQGTKFQITLNKNQ